MHRTSTDASSSQRWRAAGLALSKFAQALLKPARSSEEGGAPRAVASTRQEAEECPICFAEPVAFALSCGHELCTRCMVHYVREALANANTQVFPQGIRCPMHSSGCAQHFTSTEAARLLTRSDAAFMADRDELGESEALSARRKGPLYENLSRQPAVVRLRRRVPSLYAWAERGVAALSKRLAGIGELDAPGELNLSVDEVIKLHVMEVEAAIPHDQRTWCPRCKRVLMLPEAAPPLMGVAKLLAWLRIRRPPRTPDPQCLYCGHTWDPRAGAGDADYDDRASRAYIRATSKPCPNPACEQRVSHFHGHACHHISPYTNGCPSCHLHFCYVCLRPHGTPGSGYIRHRMCPHGSSFCKADGIVANLRTHPYPHDRRCGCPICSHCARGRPCAQCDGQCVVCLGIVPPGPQHLSAEAVRAILGTGCAPRCFSAGCARPRRAAR